MDGKTWLLYFLILISVLIEAWRSSYEDTKNLKELPVRRDIRREAHYHTKRHMLPENQSKERRVTTKKARENRKLSKKPSGHLTPLEEDDIDNDEVVSVAIGPPPMSPKYEKVQWKPPPKTVITNNTTNNAATNLVKDVLTQLGKELLSRQVSQDFIFGQYVAITMKNLTAELKLQMQHEILELILKYQKFNRGEISKSAEEKLSSPNPSISPMNLKENKPVKKFVSANDTDETWPDFSNLEKIVR